MRSMRNRGHARPPMVSGPPAVRWRRRLTAGVVTSLTAVGLAAASVTAASAAPLPPAAGVSPAVVAAVSALSTSTPPPTAQSGPRQRPEQLRR